MARRDRRHVTRAINPPVEWITPAIARDWLRRRYYPLSMLAAMGCFPNALYPPRHRDDLRLALASLSLDVIRIAYACHEALDTRRAVRMTWDRCELRNPMITRRLRLLMKYEQQHGPFRGTRGVLRRALCERERIARQKRDSEAIDAG